MKLSYKQRMRRALLHESVDHLPTQVNYTGEMGRNLAAHYGVSLDTLPKRLGNHLLRVDLNFPHRLSQDGKAYFDWWGVGWSTETEGYWPVITPLAEATNLDAYPWPDPTAPDLLDDAAKIIARDAGEHFIAPNLGFVLFERAWSLRGFENFCMDLVTNPAYVGELLDRITEIQLAVARRFIELGVDGGYYGDDYGAQKNMLISPKHWREFFKPRLARLFAVFRQAGLPVILHSDGDIDEIIPDLVEIGLTTLNPVQPEVINHAWLKQTFGTRLSFYGGVSTQSVLPLGTPAQVRDAARECMRVLAPDGTGLVLAPSHRMTADIPMENVDALLDVFAELEK
jgi:uroporphyrinogen decarboxylase